MADKSALDDITEIINATHDEPSRRDASLAALAQLEGVELRSQPQEALQQLAQSVSEKLLQPQLLPTDGSSKTGDATSVLIGETALSCLTAISSALQEALDGEVLVVLLAYTNPSSPYASDRAAELANSLLSNQLADDDKLTHFIVEVVLKGTLRPLFSKSTSRVTSSGRPSHLEQPAKSATATTDGEAPWKQAGGIATMARLQWAVKASNEALIRAHWPLFAPPLLTVVEDTSTVYRAYGLEILDMFVAKCPAEILQSTGLHAIIEDAVFPTLMFLPSLTPEDESISLLHPAYRTLICLAERNHSKQEEKSRRSLDRLVRGGIIAGYHHASQYPRIVEVLMAYTATIVNHLGLSASRHLEARDTHGCEEISQQLIAISNGLQQIWKQSQLDLSPRLSELMARRPQLAELFAGIQAQ
ncbi:hypothetical protein B0I35DRAFT_472604 [Stachybotrys elegans]|uniref:Uncharacterized protein n=1 Tax=Stachybotrys elegans TaxID=80388 RepID=A0A8K0T2U3_9HYPO|nr:hypothetical protein B0I35DRAFT_472604 [Stachybotrys elegans]